MKVAQSIIQCLARFGVREVFGVPGDAVNHLVDGLRQEGAVEFIHVAHEESGAFAASAQAKLGAPLGACMGTAGPGAIHLMNGLYDAGKDRAPVIAITGQVPRGSLGRNAHQEIDLHEMFAGVACYNQRHMKLWFHVMDHVEKADGETLHPQAFCRALGKQAAENAIFCCDTGSVTSFFAKSLRVREGQQVTLSGNLATMAYGLEAMRVSTGDDIERMVGEALAHDRPILVDVQVNPRQMLFPPKITLKQAFGFSVAKVKEFWEAASP